MYVVDEAKLVDIDLPKLNIDWTVYNTKSEEKFERTYHIISLIEDMDEDDIIVELGIADVANALASQHLSGEPSFMHVLDLDPMNAPEFSEYVNTEFNSRETVIAAIKDYTIRLGVNYPLCESKLTTFYAKCRKFCWVIKWYNGNHTCTKTTISQDHTKMNSDTIAKVIKPLVEVDPSLKVKFVIVEAIGKIFGGWEASYEALSSWFKAIVQKEPSAIVEIETAPAY
ncbi:hypothetical protein Ahy_A07g034218 isoform A [Arachis hypogaea]|uniref:Transposase MuDR plant domain-containing protein n=1 Tax=Arachis hypogaea TaxID=3818 RepID=A0A445CBC7_ARAHY|nr:hypothetical protein Ahy_A07g034218 isoform A [Arachis hypogaea]